MDASIIDAARRGNRQAQAVLLNHLQDPWYRLCISMLRNSDLARDATQETALRFLRQLPTFRHDSHIQSWSMGIAINVVREMRRSAGRATAVEPQTLDSVNRDAVSPSESASLSEQSSLLHSLLSHLPERQREAIVLRFFQQLSVDDTAAAMECSPGTVKATVHQALRSLRSKFQTT